MNRRGKRNINIFDKRVFSLL